MRELFKGKKYLITGASAGIGKEFARELHARGADVVLVARREDRLRQLANELNGKRGGSATFLVIDLGNGLVEHGGCKELERYLSSERIDGLINNAGFGSFGRFEELDREREDEMIRVNVTAPLRLTHAVISQMLERKSGVIVNLASIAAFQPLPYMATYAATKAMNLYYSMAHHYEYKKCGIRVLAVCPGPIATEFGEVAAIPGAFKDTPGDTVETVVNSSLRALQRNQSFVLPGIVGGALGRLSRFTPYWFNMRIATSSLVSKLP